MCWLNPSFGSWGGSEGKGMCVMSRLARAGSYEAWPPDAIFTRLLLKLLQGGMIQW